MKKLRSYPRRSLLSAVAGFAAGVALVALLLAPGTLAQNAKKKNRTSRPHPPQVAPGAKPGQPPSDAIVLFDGKDLGKWVTPGRGRQKGQDVAPRWKVKGGYVEVAVPG